MVDTDFVVYGYLRKDYNSFYYIGKGRPNRPYSKNKRTIPHPGCRSRIVILYSNIPEELALENEKKLISLMGRIGIDEGGVLRNRNPGGEGVSKKHAEELKQRKYLYRQIKLSEERKNWFHISFGEVSDLSPKELIKTYSNQKLNLYALNKVARGKIYSHKGWILLENKNSIHPTFDWYHDEHGILNQKSIKELISNFPTLKIQGLNAVIERKSLSHYGWKLLENRFVNRIGYRGEGGRDWHHREHGTFLDTYYLEISKRFGVKRDSLRKVSMGEKITYKGWRLLENKDLVFDNEKKPENWEHQFYGTVKNCSAGELVRMFPDQNLIESSLRRVARSKSKNHKGWSLEGNLVVEQPEPVGNWYNPEYGSFFGKTPGEMAKVDKRKVVRPHMFMKMLSDKSKSLRGWILLKKCAKVKKTSSKGL